VVMGLFIDCSCFILPTWLTIAV